MIEMLKMNILYNLSRKLGTGEVKMFSQQAQTIKLKKYDK
jgi:hypothetical protein